MIDYEVSIANDRGVIVYEGHKITYAPSFNGEGMAYQWMLRDTPRSFVVMQHATIEEAFAMIDKYEHGFFAHGLTKAGAS